jgi:adenine C2-methylase RlmN of 23S rRNA A2503 and tRNA A37
VPARIPAPEGPPVTTDRHPGTGSRYDVDRAALAAALAGEPRYRVDQVWRGLYERLAGPEEMTDVPRALRERLAADLPPALV